MNYRKRAILNAPTLTADASTILDAFRAMQETKSVADRLAQLDRTAATSKTFDATLSAVEQAQLQLRDFEPLITKAYRALAHQPAFHSAVIEAQRVMAKREAALRSITDAGLSSKVMEAQRMIADAGLSSNVIEAQRMIADSGLSSKVAEAQRLIEDARLSSKLAEAQRFIADSRLLSGVSQVQQQWRSIVRAAGAGALSQSIAALTSNIGISELTFHRFGPSGFAATLAERVRQLETEDGAVAEWLQRLPMPDESHAGSQSGRLRAWLESLAGWFATAASLPKSETTTKALWCIWGAIATVALSLVSNEITAWYHSKEAQADRAERREHQQIVTRALADIARQLQMLPIAFEPFEAVIGSRSAVVRDSPHAKARQVDRLGRGRQVKVLGREGQWMKIDYVTDGGVQSVGWTYRNNLAASAALELSEQSTSGR